MEVLKIEHEDFDLLVESEKLASSFGKALAKQRNILEATEYTVSSGKITLISPDFDRLETVGDRRTHPVFFENRDYFVGILFKAKEQITDAAVRSRRKDVEGKFSFRREINFLSGTISFGNELGKSDLSVFYRLDGQGKDFVFHFEVFPTKLDFRTDYDRIVTDIEEAYPNLVLDFLKKTYSSFDTHKSPNTDLIWWQIFGGIYSDLISASRFILNKPHNRIIRNSRFVLADRIKRWSPQLEEELGRFRQNPQKRYHAQFETLTIDTPENRFFKYAIRSTARRFKGVKDVIETKYSRDMSDGFRDELQGVEETLNVISNNPLFRRVSEFRGFKQESLVLQKATGYRNIFKAWIILNSGLRFFDGLQKIELKNIADLYQMWCFLEMKSMLQNILNREHPDDIDLSEIDSNNFIVKLRQGSRSRVAFKKDDGDLVELFHEFPYKTSSRAGVKSFTVSQEPDIVLRLTKNDLIDGYALTYLFDAKYRLQSDDDIDAPDNPPDDAINQMHRYRDSIYFSASADVRPEKEVIGAYVLFPGCGEPDRVISAEYYRSIAAVNIGAFPLRPNDSDVRLLLENHLATTMGVNTQSTLDKVARQKQMSYEPTNPYILIGFVRPTSFEACFSNTDHPFYYTGSNKPQHLGRSDLKYFAPYQQGIGITEYFEILDYSTAPRNSLFKDHPKLMKNGDASERIIIRLGKRHKLPRPCKPVAPANPYLYTSLSYLRNPQDGTIQTILSESI